jgi:hypothetical protein
MQHEVKFEMEKETKNTIRYKEITEGGKPPVIGALYVQKWVFVETPQTIQVILKYDEK